MRTLRVLAAFAAATVLLGTGSQPPAPIKEAPKEPAAAAGQSLDSVSFMSGRWRGHNENGVFEEHWSSAEGNNIMGMFRWVKDDGTPVMFELLTMTQEPEGLFMRIKHFNAKLVAREDKDDAVTLKLAESGPARAVFKGVETEKRVAAAEYEKTADGLHITIRFTDDKRPPLNFDLKKIGEK